MLKELLLDILLPKKCVGCKKEGRYICKNCELFLSEVNIIEAKPYSMSVWEYEGLMEKLIQKIKFDGCYDIIDELVDRAFEKITLDLPSDAVITYVPMYKNKEKQRGFNQAELIAKRIGEKIDKPVVKLLEKTKDNRTQVGLSPQERLENVKNVFTAVNITEVKPQSVLLMDDFYTTGATMQECIKVLRKAGVKNVYGFTIARKLSL